MGSEWDEPRGNNPFQAALLSIAVVLIAVGLVTFGLAASRANPTALYPDAAAHALPSLIWGGVIIGIGAVAFLFWLLVSAVRWKARAADPHARLLSEAAASTELA
jgi:uncharacterized BrkB/YihY/UPF0761 family membrane protein